MRKASMLFLFIVSFALSGVAFAQASLPTEATQAFADMETITNEAAGLAWSLVAVVMAAVIGIRLFKKFASRAV